MNTAELRETMDSLAVDDDFSGVVSVRVGDEIAFEAAYGFADRAGGRPNKLSTRFGLASGSKAFTALTVMRLVENRRIALSTTARSLLGTDLPLVDSGVTVEHLLAHRSGIGDYLDETLLDDVEVWPFELASDALMTTPDYLPLLDGRPQTFAPGTRFAYCNGGYVLLASLCERVAGTPYVELVQRHVLEPADLRSTAFLDLLRLPIDAALGYLADGRPNTANLPRRGSGDGGCASTVADLARFWRAFFAGSIVGIGSVRTMIAPRGDAPSEGKRYGLGFWLDQTNDSVSIEGFDAGVSFRSTHDPGRGLTATVISNSTYGAGPMLRALRPLLNP